MAGLVLPVSTSVQKVMVQAQADDKVVKLQLKLQLKLQRGCF